MTDFLRRTWAQIDLDAPGNGIMYVQEVSRIYGQMK